MEGSRLRHIVFVFLIALLSGSAGAVLPPAALASDVRVPVMPRTLKPLNPSAVTRDTSGQPADRWVNDLQLKAHLALNDFHQWQGGGADTRTWFTGVNGTMRRLGVRTEWASRIILDYGEVRTEGQGTRKNLDKIFLESVLHMTNRSFLKPFLSVSGQSQFTRGYDYDQQPYRAVSGFRDPLILTQTGGLGRQLVKDCHLRLGAAVRETFTRDHVEHTDDPATPGVEKRKTEGGFESVTSLDTRVNGTVVIKSRLEIFMGFDSTDTVDVDWDNEVTLRAWGALGVNYRFQLRYDEDIYAGLQTRQMLGVGLNLDLL